MMLNKYDYRILRRALRGELRLDSPRKRANAARVARKLDTQQAETCDTVIKLINGVPHIGPDR